MAKCGAKTRNGGKCQRNAMANGRCNLHGGKSPGAPKGNKYAVRTGEFESISIDMLDDDEKQLYGVVDTDPIASIDRTIRMMEIRERRMMRRILELQRGSEMVNQLRTTQHQERAQFGESDNEGTTQEAATDRIQRIEEALTRLQEKKGKYIELKAKLTKQPVDEEFEQLRNEKLKTEIAKARGVETELQEDDGFMDAMHGVAEDVWSDERDDDPAEG